MSVAWDAMGHSVGAAVVVVLFGAVLATALATTGAAQAAPSCTASPTTVAPAEPVTLDAAGTENATTVEFDVDGDGTYDRTDSTDFVVQASYDQPGNYSPSVRAIGANSNDTATADCGTVTVVRNQPPRAQLAVDPGTVAVDEPVTLDASNSTDPDGTIGQYRWDVDGDGTVDADTDVPTLEQSYDAPGSYRVSVTVRDEDGANATATAEVVVEAAQPTAACSVAPTTVESGGEVMIDASDARNADAIDVDVNGDGTVDRTLTATFQTTVTYADPGTVQPTVTARNDAGEDTVACEEVAVLAAGSTDESGGAGSGSAGGDGGSAANGSDGGSAANGSDGGDGGVLGSLADAFSGASGGPGSPLHAGGTLFLLGAVGWLLGRVQRTTDDPRPRGVFEWRSDLEERFAAGRVDVEPFDDGEAASIAVDIAFEPDLLLLAARGSRSDAPADGGPVATATPFSNGIALRTADGVVQHALGANRAGAEPDTPPAEPDTPPAEPDTPPAEPDTPPAESGENDSPNAAPANGAVVALPADGERREASVAAIDEDGFEIICDADLDATILYRAVKFPADVEVTVGTTAVSAGESAVKLPDASPLDALLLDAVAATSTPDGNAGEDSTRDAGPVPSNSTVADTNSGATDGSVTASSRDAVAWSVGTATRDGEEQSVASGDGERATVAADRVLALGRGGPTARLDVGTGTPTLSYDESASADHWLQVVSLSGAPRLAPATGTVAVDAGDDPVAVELGFESAFVEYWVARGDGSIDDGPWAGVALAGAEGVEQFALDDAEARSDRASVGVVGVTGNGIEFGFTCDESADETTVRIAYRAWPGAPGSRGSNGTTEGGELR